MKDLIEMAIIAFILFMIYLHNNGICDSEGIRTAIECTWSKLK